MLSEKLSIDGKDIKILSMTMNDPDVSQAELAKALGISQPSVNARVQKLKKKGVLVSTVGFECNQTDMCLARVDFTAPDVNEVMNRLKNCSFFVNGFSLSGKHNASIMIVSTDLKKIDRIITSFIRSVPGVEDVNMSVVVGTTKPFICNLNLEQETNSACQDLESCESCPLKE